MASLETSQVADFLRGHLGGDACEVAPLGQGDWSQAFSFSHDGTEFVARLGAYVEGFEKDRFAVRFAAPGLPIPRVLEIGQALGRYFCVSERAYGTYLEELDAAEMRRIVPAVCQMLSVLQQANLSDTSGFGGWEASGDAPHSRWHEYLLTVNDESEWIPGWHRRMEESPTGSTPFYEALDFLKAHLKFCPSERYLIHNDLLHGNTLVSEDRISAVIDWGCGLYGDFLYDLAMFTFYASWYPAMDEIDWAGEAKTHFERSGIEIPHFEERLRCCEVHIALGNMAYSAFRQRWDDLADNARRLTERLAL